MENVMTSFLEERFPEEAPASFYRELFPAGSLAKNSKEKGRYNAVLMRLLPPADGIGGMKGEPHFVFDDLVEVETTLVLDSAMPGVIDLLSPVSYSGRSPKMSMAHELFALTFDLDGVKVKEDGTPQGLIDLLFWMDEVPDVRGPLLPTPTYIVSSGTGLHLYYMLESRYAFGRTFASGSSSSETPSPAGCGTPTLPTLLENPS